MLGVEPGASPDDIKAAWRALARQHHPDLIGDDPESAQRATRRMAEINAAYAALTRAGETIEGRRRRRATAPGRANGDRDAAAAGDGHRATRRPAARQAHPARSPARLDLSGTVRPRNQTTTPPGARMPADRPAAAALDRSVPELRASQPSGPLERDMVRRTTSGPSRRPRRRPRPRARLRQVPRPHAGRGRRVRAVVRGLAGRHGDARPRARAGGAGHPRGAGPAGDPAGAPARAAGLAVEPVPLGAPARTVERLPPAISPEARMKSDQCYRPATRACWPIAPWLLGS